MDAESSIQAFPYSRFRSILTAASAITENNFQSTHYKGWQTDCLDLCESFWALLSDIQAPPDLLQAFIDLLMQPSAFALAQMVLPELRQPPGREYVLNRQKQHILTATAHLRPKEPLSATAQLPQDPLYLQERKILSDVEFHRLSVLLYDTANLTPEQQEAIREWIARRPVFNANTATY